MPQQMLSFKYEKDPTNNKLTALGGLPLYLDLMTSLGFIQSLRQCLDPKEIGHGWSMSYSEQVHLVMKEDLAGGKLPSGKFGVNAAWWQIMVLALNVAEAMKRLVLEGTWVRKRMKALRFHLINIAGRVIERGRQIRIRLSGEHPAFELICQARKRIAELAAIET
jgi:hypothetical protein